MASNDCISTDVMALLDFLQISAGNSVVLLQTTRDLSSLLSNIDTLRRQAHELFEAETISASNLRYKLKMLRQTFEVELADTTQAVVAYTVERKRNRQMCICEVQGAKAKAHRRHSDLGLKNKDLMLRLISTENGYKELIGGVNEIMTDRSKVKIHLNETQGELQSVLTEIKASEKKRLHLEDTARDSESMFLVEMSELSTNLEEVKKHCDANCDKNRQLSKWCDEVEENLTSARHAMKVSEELLADTLRQHESELYLRQKVEMNIVQAHEMAEKLSKEWVALHEMCQLGRRNVQSEEKELLQHYDMMLMAVDEKRKEVKALLAEQQSAQAALMRERKLKDKHQLSVSCIQKSCATTKEKLKYQSEKGSELQTVNRELELKIAECNDSHSVVSRQLKDQIENLSNDLKYKESERMKLEEEINTLNLQIRSLENELKVMTIELADTKGRHSVLCCTSEEKLSKLRCDSEKAEQQIECLSHSLTVCKTELETFRASMELQSHTLQENIGTANATLLERLTQLEYLEPRCLEFDQTHAHKKKEYNAEKEAIIGMRNHRTTLKDMAKRLNQRLKDIIVKEEELRLKIIYERTCTKDHFALQTLQKELSEAEVSHTEQELRGIANENSRISEVMQATCLECLWLKKLQTTCKTDSMAVPNKKENLEKQWGGDRKMEQEQVRYCDSIMLKTLSLSTQVEMRKQELKCVHPI